MWQRFPSRKFIDARMEIAQTFSEIFSRTRRAGDYQDGTLPRFESDQEWIAGRCCNDFGRIRFERGKDFSITM
jgi:hypothetical protein